MALSLRPATAADVPAAAGIWHREEVHWFGAAQHTATSLEADIVAFGALADGVAVDEDGTLVGWAAVSRDGDSGFGVEPDRVETALPYLLPWLAEHATDVDVPDCADGPLAQLRGAGWTETRTWMEMGCEVGTASLEVPVPDGVELRTVEPDEAEQVHHVVYVDAAWAEVRGHRYRPFDSWHKVFTPRAGSTAVRTAAWRGQRCVGWVGGVLEDDGAAFVQQVAVAKDERGRGLGRALLAHAFGSLVAAGATKLGLHVQDANVGALGLYRTVGLEIERTWLVFAPPPSA